MIAAKSVSMVTREELYELVWSQPMTKIAQSFDVSGSYLARICTLLNVPRPERGYWAKLAVGKAPNRSPLRPAQPGDPTEWSKDGDPVSMPKPQAPKASRGERPKRKVRIARDHVHPIIRGTKPLFERTRQVEEGMYLKPYKLLLPNVVASQSSLDKALDLANDLFNALQSVGHRVMVASAGSGLRRISMDEREGAAKPRQYWEHTGLWSPYRPTVVYVGTVAIGLAIIEMSETVTLRYLKGKYIRDSDYVPPRGRHSSDSSWTTTREMPSGRMRIFAYSPYGKADWVAQWQDSKSSSVRNQLAAIVAAIEDAAPLIVAKIAEAERLAEIRRQEWLIAEDRRKRVEDRRLITRSIEESHSELREIIAKWSNVVNVDRFLSGVAEAALNQSPDDYARIERRLAEARILLGTTDPFDFFRNWKTPAERYKPRYPIDGE